MITFEEFVKIVQESVKDTEFFILGMVPNTLQYSQPANSATTIDADSIITHTATIVGKIKEGDFYDNVIQESKVEFPKFDAVISDIACDTIGTQDIKRVLKLILSVNRMIKFKAFSEYEYYEGSTLYEISYIRMGDLYDKVK